MPPAGVVRFGAFEVNARSGELRKNGVLVPVQDQPLQVLIALLERPGEVVTREELRQRLWPGNTFVDYERGLNAAVNRLRDTLGDSAEAPQFIETVPRRGYRLIAAVADTSAQARTPEKVEHEGRRYHRAPAVATIVLAAAIAAVVAAWWAIGQRTAGKARSGPARTARSLTRLTFGPGLQTDPAISPDGTLIAYASDRAGTFDIWVRSVQGGDPVQVTRSPDQESQPDWSPDGKSIVFRSSAENGGLFTIPPLGGVARKLTTFGFRPRFSPDGLNVLLCSPRASKSLRIQLILVIRTKSA